MKGRWSGSSTSSGKLIRLPAPPRCVYVRVHVCVCAPAFGCVLCACTYLFRTAQIAFGPACLCICVRVRPRACAPAHTHECVRVCMREYVYTYDCCMYTSSHTSMYTGVCVSVWANAHTRTHTHTPHTHTHTHIHTVERDTGGTRRRA